MRYSELRYLVIFLSALQSVVAMADVNPTDQIGGINSDFGYQIKLLDEADVFSAKRATDQSLDLTGGIDSLRFYALLKATLTQFARQSFFA